MKTGQKASAAVDALMTPATAALRHAHSPYTGKRAGVAVRLTDGRIFAGCNVESPAFYGYEALETAAGIMLVDSLWTAGGTVPQITDVFYCFDDVWDDHGGWLPGPLGLGLMRIFGNAGTRFYFAAVGSGVFDEKGWSDLVSSLPPPGFDLDVFAKEAHERWQKAQGVVNHMDQLDNLYRARLQAFNPVSNYAVGAMVETACGKTFYGCNVEVGGNKALHAENVAIAAMVSSLGPAARIKKVTILTGGPPGFPCGGCRQHINEFALPDAVVVGLNIKGERQEMRQADLLPHSFGRAKLESGVQDQ